jgi:succinate dehydrogenase flavin-adding protein (antitoxin of CptAB toxin-antitoxin module)
MTPDTLRQIGEALYGDTWQAQMTRLLDIDSRRVAHWLEGTRPIPDRILTELVAELRRRGNRAIALAEKL